MSEVVEFHSKNALSDVIWKCNHCYNTTWYLYADGTIECGHCKRRSAGDVRGFWLRKLPDSSMMRIVDAKETDRPMTTTDHYGTDLGIKRFVEDILHWRVSAAVLIYPTGRVSVRSSDLDYDAGKAWLRRRLDDAFQLLTGGKVDEEEDRSGVPGAGDGEGDALSERPDGG